MAVRVGEQAIAPLGLQDENNTFTVTADAPVEYHLSESAQSNEVTIDTGAWSYELLGNGTWGVAGRGDMTGANLVIRAYRGNVPVTEIVAGAFQNDTTLESVTIPTTITRIGRGAFKGSGLKTVIFKDTEDMVIFFKNLAEWPQVYVHYTYTNGTGEQWNGGWPGEPMDLFDAAQNIYSFKVPLTITSICFNRGDEEAQTETLDVTDFREDLSYNLFTPKDSGNNFSALNRERYNPGTSYVKYDGLQISNSAFEGCGGLTEIELPRRAVNIGPSAFRNCTNLTKISNPAQNRLLQVGDHAFASCSKLVFVTLNTGLREIRRYAFWGCSKLSGVQLGSALELIDMAVFLDCPDFQTVTIPASVTKIGYEAFDFTERPEGSWSRSVMFENPYTWFVSTGDTPGLEAMDVIAPTELIASSMSDYTASRNGNKLSLLYADYCWHRLDKMLPPTLSLENNKLIMTDTLGVAENFYIYINGAKVVTIDKSKIK